jgi:hypothetical protein
VRCGAAGEGGANNCLPVRGRFALTFPMLFESREVRPGPRRGLVLNEHGVVEAVPTHWDLLAPGDAALSRRIKQDGPSLTLIELKGRKRFSRGIWAPADRIEALRRELALERQEPAYLRKLEAGRRGREREQAAYAVEFREAVRWYLAFHPAYQAEGEVLAGLVADHAVPVGSGTVARTERIPIEERAAAATIAWMRHQTTGYDQMSIARVKGKRREVRRMLAQRSTQLLAAYREGQGVNTVTCPLYGALRAATSPNR